MSKAKKVLIIANDVVGGRMGGPGLRCWSFAEVLSRHFEVTLMGPNNFDDEYFKNIRFKYCKKGDCKISDLIRANDCLISDNYIRYLPYLSGEKLVILDLYDPILIADLEKNKNLPMERQIKRNKELTEHVLLNLLNSDYYICSNERQKSLYLGMLLALNMIGPELLKKDAELKNVIEIVPFGIKQVPPEHDKKVLKGVIPGIDEKDKILWWGGFVNNWFDPISLFKAMELVSRSRQDIKLIMPPLQYPNPKVKVQEKAREAYAYAQQKSLLNKSVFYLKEWIPNRELGNYLCEADIGISTHYESLETYYSFRTRILDYIWAKLPIITSKGDYFADLVERFDLGYTVNYGDAEDIKEKILSVVSDEKKLEHFRGNLEKVQKMFYWENQLKDLVAYIRDNDAGSKRKPNVLKRSAQFLKYGIRTIMRSYLTNER